MSNLVRIKNHNELIEELRGCRARIIGKTFSQGNSIDVIILEGTYKGYRFSLLETLLETIDDKERVVFT